MVTTGGSEWWRRHRTLSAIALLLAGSMCLGTSGCASEKPATDSASSPSEEQSSSETPAPEPEPEPEPPVFDKAAHSIDDPSSIWIVANKLRQLQPASYVPGDLTAPQVDSTNGQPLREEAARATETLVAAAAADGVYLQMISGYRSYDTQVSVYGGYVANYGQAAADTTSARPGHSEHQTGLSVDFDGADGCMLDACFGETAAGQWLTSHAAEYGFTERYPSGLEHITGYMYEPWHYRYVGSDLALELRAQGILTLEEFFELPAAPDYAG